jgi:hypothetical protein
VCFLNVASCPSSLRCPKWWRRFFDLFYFPGHLPQGIVSGFCWCKTLQECKDAIIFVANEELFWPPLWSSDQSTWLQIQRSGFDSRRYEIFWEVVSLERGPLSLLSTTEELLERKNSDSGLEIWEYGRRDPSRWSRGTLYPQKLALTSPTSSGRSVGIVRSRTQATEFSVFNWGVVWIPVLLGVLVSVVECGGRVIGLFQTEHLIVSSGDRPVMNSAFQYHTSVTIQLAESGSETWSAFRRHKTMSHRLTRGPQFRDHCGFFPVAFSRLSILLQTHTVRNGIQGDWRCSKRIKSVLPFVKGMDRYYVLSHNWGPVGRRRYPWARFCEALLPTYRTDCTVSRPGIPHRETKNSVKSTKTAYLTTNKHRGLSPRANYADRAIAACQRS